MLISTNDSDCAASHAAFDEFIIVRIVHHNRQSLLRRDKDSLVAQVSHNLIDLVARQTVQLANPRVGEGAAVFVENGV